MKIEILMSTCNHPLIRDIDLKQHNITGPFVVVNQFADENSVDENSQGSLFSYAEKGLAKSRNRLLQHMQCDIGVISDDDITFVENYENIIKLAYEDHPSADVITFNLKIGDKLQGDTKEFKHNFRSIMSVASCQISFRQNSIRENKIKFDENFGLGSLFISGEENLFLNDCLNKGLEVIHIPLLIALHPQEETTGELWSEKLVESKGALSYALLGIKHWLFFFFFLIAKRNNYKKTMSVGDFIRSYRKGIKTYRKVT